MWPTIRIAVLIAAMGASTSLFAESQPTPRQPLGPGDLSRQFPLGLQGQAPTSPGLSGPTAGPDSIAVTNLGNTTLSFSAWDGTASWKPFQLGSGQSVTISCPPCGSEIPVAFHDGAQTRTVNAKTADSYGLFWDSAKGRWDFASTAAIRGQAR